jgi:hypothetical protein
MHWTEHHNYDEISILTSLSMSGECSSDTKKVIRKHCDALFMEMWDEGVDCEGWEPVDEKEYERCW